MGILRNIVVAGIIGFVLASVADAHEGEVRTDVDAVVARAAVDAPGADHAVVVSAVDQLALWSTNHWAWPLAASEAAVPAWFRLHEGPWNGDVEAFSVASLRPLVHEAEVASSRARTLQTPEAHEAARERLVALRDGLASASAQLDRALAADRTYRIALAGGLIATVDGQARVQDEAVRADRCVALDGPEVSFGTPCVRLLAHRDAFTRDYLHFLAQGGDVRDQLVEAVVVADRELAALDRAKPTHVDVTTLAMSKAR